MGRLLKVEIDKSLTVRLDRSIKADGVNGYMQFGVGNDYPVSIHAPTWGATVFNLNA